MLLQDKTFQQVINHEKNSFAIISLSKVISFCSIRSFFQTNERRFSHQFNPLKTRIFTQTNKQLVTWKINRQTHIYYILTNETEYKQNESNAIWLKDHVFIRERQIRYKLVYSFTIETTIVKSTKIRFKIVVKPRMLAQFFRGQPFTRNLP